MTIRNQTLFASFLLLASCGPKEDAAPPPVQMMTAADEILRIGETWSSSHAEKAILSPPSKISLSNTIVRSEISFSQNSARERLTIQEEVSLRSGGTIHCETTFEHALRLKWGRKQGEAAVKLQRPSLSGPRACNGPHPELVISRPSAEALFVLRSDELIPVEPPLEKRRYIPLAL